MAKRKQNGSGKRSQEAFLGKSADEWIAEAMQAERSNEFRELIAAAVRIYRSGDKSLTRAFERNVRAHQVAGDLLDRGIPFEYVPGPHGFTAAIAIKGGKSKNPKRAAPAAMPLGPFAEPSDTENEKPPV
jgi:hypothetical protein